MSSQANTHQKDASFFVTWVFIQLQPYRQLTLQGRPSPKLAHRYFRPYEVKRAIGRVAYELHLPGGAMLHPVFHISKLKRFYSAPSRQIVSLAPESRTRDLTQNHRTLLASASYEPETIQHDNSWCSGMVNPMMNPRGKMRLT